MIQYLTTLSSSNCCSERLLASISCGYPHEPRRAFSGEDFTVDESVGLNGTCDFLLSRSPKLIEIEAPVFVLVEAKKSDLKMGLGQCAAEMVAAQRFNQNKGQIIPYIYGCISNGTQWRFLKLDNHVLTIDLNDYPLPPVGQILAFLTWIAQN